MCPGSWAAVASPSVGRCCSGSLNYPPLPAVQRAPSGTDCSAAAELHDAGRRYSMNRKTIRTLTVIAIVLLLGWAFFFSDD